MHPKYALIATLAVLAASRLRSQDVEKAIDQTRQALRDPLSASGSIGASTVFYRSFGIQPRRDPFYWVLNANLSFTILNKITVPFSAVITQQDKNFTNGLDKFSQPFNQFGLSPRYRWITVHAGYRSLDFSEYSLSGTVWLGGGAEVAPSRSPWSGAAFYGRFLKAVPRGGVEGIVVSLPSYERWGGGGKVRMEQAGTMVEAAFLRIGDRPYSIPFDTLLTVTPHQNQLISLAARQRLLSWVSASGDLCLSMFTKNLYEPVSTATAPAWLERFFEVRPSSQFDKALNTSLDFTPSKCQFSLKYKRIDPDYRSLGAIFLTNDVEEISANASLPLNGSRIVLNGGAGLQRNNLDQKQVLTSRRVVGSANVSFNLTEHFNVSLNYNSFSSNTIAQRELFTDSIRFVQITQSFGMQSSVAFGETLKQQLSGGVSYQEMIGTQQPPGKCVNLNLSYLAMLGESGWSFNVSALYNEMKNELQGTYAGAGPQVSVQKTLLRTRLRLGITGGSQDSYLEGKLAANNLNGTFNVSYSPAPSHSFRFDYNVLRRSALSSSVAGFMETRGNLSYTCNFKAGLRDHVSK